MRQVQPRQSLRLGHVLRADRLEDRHVLAQRLLAFLPFGRDEIAPQAQFDIADHVMREMVASGFGNHRMEL
jgi:hypothetical protein